MAARAARIRTESMAVRLSKKPVEEGYELWDQGFLLGALRLFVFKAEGSPPFMAAPCLDAAGTLLLSLGDCEEAAEVCEAAAEKYDLVKQPILALLMRFKATEARYGVESAFNAVNAYIEGADEFRQSHTHAPKIREAMGRMFLYYAELLGSTSADNSLVMAELENSIKCNWVRSHLSYSALGEMQVENGQLEDGIANLRKAIELCGHHSDSYVALSKALQRSGDQEGALENLNTAIQIHTRAVVIRDKAYLLAEMKQVDDAIAMLDGFIQEPPQEEMEVLQGASSLATLMKTKAAVLADEEKLEDALAVLNELLESHPDDAEAQQMKEDIDLTLNPPPAEEEEKHEEAGEEGQAEEGGNTDEKFNATTLNRMYDEDGNEVEKKEDEGADDAAAEATAEEGKPATAEEAAAEEGKATTETEEGKAAAETEEGKAAAETEEGKAAAETEEGKAAAEEEKPANEATEVPQEGAEENKEEAANKEADEAATQ